MLIHQRSVIGEINEDRRGKLDLRSGILETIATHIQRTRPPTSQAIYFDATTNAGLRINVEIEPQPVPVAPDGEMADDDIR